LEALSPRAQAIKLLLADEMSDGYNLTTLASELGLSPSSASSLLAELRSEIELQSGPLPDLSAEEQRALINSIEDEGVRVPIVIGRHMLIDGRHRLMASKLLGLTEIPVVFVSDLDQAGEYELSIALNANRRQLTKEQKQSLVRKELQRDWSRSDRRIAEVCGVSHPTVGSIRNRMRQEETAQPAPETVEAVRAQIERDVERPSTETRIDTLGREYPVQVVPVDGPERPLGYIVCGRCTQRHALYRDGNGYRTEVV
jgi:AraC-like DNA-binding protein